MTDLINLPADAARRDFAPFVGADEFYSLYIGETKSGTKYALGTPGLDIVGKRVVRFEQVTSGGRRSSVHVGWRKVITNYVIEGAGKTYKWDDRDVCNYYVREA